MSATTGLLKVADGTRYEIEHHACALKEWAQRMEREAREENANPVKLEEWYARAQLAVELLRKYVEQATKETER